MEALLDYLVQIAAKTVPVALVFGALAVATKRRDIAAALHRCRRESGTNLTLFVVNYILLAPLFLAVTLTVADSLPRVAALEAVWRKLPSVAAVAGAIVLIELAAYWRHRLEHDPALWRFHATHHADEAMTWFSVTRKHPVSKMLDMTVDTIPLLILGAPVWVLVAAQLVRGWWGYFIHADVPWTLGPLGRVLVSPAAHRLHHIRDEAFMGANYGNMLTLWDRLFGTWVEPTPHLNCATGIAEGTRGAWGELARPWEAQYRRRPTPADELAV